MGPPFHPDEGHQLSNRWKSVVEVRDDNDSWNCARHGHLYKPNLREVLGVEGLVMLCMEYFASPPAGGSPAPKRWKSVVKPPTGGSLEVRDGSP